MGRSLATGKHRVLVVTSHSLLRITDLVLQAVERELLGEDFPWTPALPDLLQAREVLLAFPLPAFLGVVKPLVFLMKASYRMPF